MTTPSPTKPVYRSSVVEKPVAASRLHAWSVLVELLDAGAVGPAAAGWSEQLLSLEPPWRRAGRLTLAPAIAADHPLVEHTVTIRDDGESCLLIWSVLVDVTADPGAADAERVVERLGAALREWADRVAETATSR